MADDVELKQSLRDLSIKTPLGEDVLILTGVDGEEPMNRLFRYRLDTISSNTDIKPTDILGKNVTFNIDRRGGAGMRPFNGHVVQFAAGSDVDRTQRDYVLEVVPWLWFLTLRRNSRIFQNKNSVDIIKQVFSDNGMSAFDVDLHGTYPVREYCVQYRETDFDFVSRLMEEEGIFYFFKHADGEHRMVLADTPTGYYDAPEKSVPFEAAGQHQGAIHQWATVYTGQPAKWTQRDYNFETPTDTLETTAQTKISVPGFKAEQFDYPGLYYKKAAGTPLTTRRMEHNEADYQVVTGASTCRTFSPGAKFKISKHDVESEVGKGYVITSVHHVATDSSHMAGGGTATYTNSFTCVPDQVPNRPPRVTEKPVVRGPQTALVVGPSGEEIHTDKYGRIKVQFFWDREGKKDDQSSCFIRVAQLWASKKWGSQFIPRINMEVIVDFLEGDPDRPICVGAVYNADNMPPYDLPANKFHSGIKSRSEKGGDADFNELRFEDNSGKELVYFHGQKDFHRVVENDDDLKVGNDQTITIANNRTEEVQKGDEKITISKGNRETKISMGNDKLTLSMGNRTTELKMGNDSTKLNLGGSTTEAMQSIELKVGANSIKIDQMGVTIKGMMVKIEGTMMTEVKGMMTQVSGDAMLTLKGGIMMLG